MQWRRDWNLVCLQLKGKLMFFFYLSRGPAMGAIKLHHITFTILVLKLIDTVLKTV